jgi:hypothetical protein
MYMKTFLTLALSLLVIGITAQNALGILKGKVLHKETNEPFIGAKVYITLAGQKVFSGTNHDGEYTINALPSGVYDVIISYDGFEPLKIEGINVNPEQFNFAPTVYLSKDKTLKDVVIKADKTPIIDKGVTGTRVTITAEQLKTMPVRFDLGRLAIATGAVSSTNDGQELYFRGSRSGDVIYMIDGIKVIGGKPVLPAASIQNFSVYTGGLPARFGDTMGGVISVETKSYFDLYYQSLRNQ